MIIKVKYSTIYHPIGTRLVWGRGRIWWAKEDRCQANSLSGRVLEGRERGGGGLNEDGTLFRRSVTNLSLGHAVRYRD